MVDETSTDFIELTSGIVSAYVSNNSVAATDLPALIKSTYEALSKVGEPRAVEVERPTPAVPIKKSVTHEHLISLEDGKPYKSLKRHLGTLGLTPQSYKAKWGLPNDYPMVSAAYSEARSNMAKRIGLGRRVGSARAEPPAKAAPAATAPKVAAKRGRPAKTA